MHKNGASIGGNRTTFEPQLLFGECAYVFTTSATCIFLLAQGAVAALLQHGRSLHQELPADFRLAVLNRTAAALPVAPVEPAPVPPDETWQEREREDGTWIKFLTAWLAG